MTRLQLRLAVHRYLDQCNTDDRSVLDARAARAADLDTADALLCRCARCGAWRLGSCSTPFCRAS